MTVSLDDGSSTQYVGCSQGSPLADVGKQYGYAISVSLSTWELLTGGGVVPTMGASNDDIIAATAADLIANLQVWSRYALIPETGQGAPQTVGGVATILAVTAQSAQSMTCGELITAIGQASPLNVVTLTRKDPSAVRGTNSTATRGAANDTAADTNNKTPDWLQSVEDYLKKIGVGVGVALVVALVIVGLLLYRKSAE